MTNKNPLSEVLKYLEQKLPDFYNMAELHDLAFTMGVDWEDLIGESKSQKSTSLLLHMAITGYLESFIQQLRYTRPNMDWPELPEKYKNIARTMVVDEHDKPDKKSEFEMSTFRKQLVTYFDLSEIQDMCFDLQIRYEDLSGNRLSDKVRELLKFGTRHNRLDDIIEYCGKERQSVTWGY